MNSLQKIGNWVGQNSLVALAISHFAKIGYIVSSSAIPAYFSASVIIMPVVGTYSSFTSFIFLFIIRFWTSFFVSKSSIVAFFATHYLAGFGSALAMRINHWSIQILLPALCMILFVMHPVAGQVWVYSFYWLIPMLLYGIYNRVTSIFGIRIVEALRATFIAHAIGSVVWAYCKPMTVAQWHILLPLVALERLVFALAIAFCCIFIDWIKTVRATMLVRRKTVNPGFES